MKNKYLVAATAIVIALMVYLASIYPSITVTVIDAETGKPIEGAVVLVEWTRQVGIGDFHTESVKVVEAVTDQEGTAKLEGCYRPFLKPPDVAVYKKGYVAWSSRIIFPDFRKRSDFNWHDFSSIMERFKPEYSFVEHTSFIHSAINAGLSHKRSIAESYYWEELEASKERSSKRHTQ